jgi:hypothetical protein
VDGKKELIFDQNFLEAKCDASVKRRPDPFYPFYEE